MHDQKCLRDTLYEKHYGKSPTVYILLWVLLVWCLLHSMNGHPFLLLCFLIGSDSKESACNVADLGSIPGLGRLPGGGHGNPLQYSWLDNPMDRGSWWATVHRVAKSWTQLKWLSMHTCMLFMASWVESLTLFFSFLF